MGRGIWKSLLNAGVVAAAVGLAAFVIARQSKGSRPHSVSELELGKQSFSADLGRLLGLINSTADDTDEQYRAALNELKGRSSEMIAETRQLLATIPGDPGHDLGLRHSLVLVTASLRDPGAIDLLSEVALNPQPLPPVDAPASRDLLSPRPEHRLNSEAEVQATIVALDAVDGLEALASDGHTSALDALVRAAATKSNAVRAAALTALGARPDWREHREKAVAGLPDDVRHLAHLVRKSVHEVPQIRDPRSTLLGSGTATRRAPGLDRDDDFPRTSVPGAPRAVRS